MDTDSPSGGEPLDAGRGIVIDRGPLVELEDAHRALLAPATAVVHEWREYRVICAGAARLEVGSQAVDAIVEGTFLLRFENQLGLARLVTRDARGRAIDTRHVEVISPKLGDTGATVRFLRAMLADLAAEPGALAFLPRAQTARTVAETHRPPSLLIQYYYLLNAAESIAEALALIERAPHRVLEDEADHVSVADLTGVDADVVRQLVQGGAAFDRRVTPPRLTAAPEGVWFRVPREGFDSAENRFARAAAEGMRAACEEVLRAPWLQGDDPGVVKRRMTLARLRERLERFGRHPMFDAVGPLGRVPVASRVLQRRAGYRELTLHWQAFLRSREPVWQRMQEAIDLRDVATLYEYWVWLALVRELTDAIGERPQVTPLPPAESGLPHGLRARFAGRGTLTYNASRRGYSGVSLRPDYLWEPVHGGKVAFDAKYRLAWDAAPLEAGDEEAPDPMARAKADDLVKMHAYRDAIPGLRAAVVIYPGTVAEFRTVGREGLRDVTVADVLESELEGIGAIPMRPEQETQGQE